jgi:hypothetical protein
MRQTGGALRRVAFQQGSLMNDASGKTEGPSKKILVILLELYRNQNVVCSLHCLLAKKCSRIFVVVTPLEAEGARTHF